MAVDLSRLSRGRVEAAPFAMVYGPEGAGKTSFCCGAPDAILLRAERGQAHLEVARYPLDVGDGGTETFTSYVELCDTLAALRDRHPEHRSVILDSATSVESLIHKDIERVCGAPLEKVHGGYGKWVTEADSRWWNVVEWLKLLHAQGRTVLVTAHAEVRPFMDPTGESFDQYSPRVHKGAKAILLSQVEHVLFLNWAVIRSKESLGFSKTRTVAASQRRMLYASKQPAFYAKNRYGLPYQGIELPDDPDNPTRGWDSFVLAASKPAEARANAKLEEERTIAENGTAPRPF